MKKLLIILAIVIVALLIFWPSSSSDTEYKGTVKDVNGNVVELVSGLKVRLIGVEPNRTDVEMFIKNNFVGKNVTVVFDSKGDQEITSLEDTVGAYLVLDETDWSINHLCAIEYEDAYVPSELTDSLDWVGARVEPEKKKDLALYMKQRTFLIATSEGTGTGFFINAELVIGILLKVIIRLALINEIKSICCTDKLCIRIDAVCSFAKFLGYCEVDSSPGYRVYYK